MRCCDDGKAHKSVLQACDSPRLSTEHLKLAPGLSQKLAAKFVGPFCVVAAVGTVSFCLELPS